ncbi:MAG: hypothetical protein M3460_06260 [Actinomycetota bacterium]|nr:hypothetical protein [Actinomycetota bacterium]
MLELFSPYSSPEEGEVLNEESATKRRRLSEFGGAAIAGALFDRLWTEPARMHEALDTTTVSPARLADLQREAAGLGVRVVRVPPTTLIDETLMHFRETRKLTTKKQKLPPAIAWLWGFKAKAHAMLGDGDSFDFAISKAHKALNSSPGDLVQPGIFSFLPEKLAFYEARGLVELGRKEEALAAAERAIILYDFSETTEPALVRFEQASAFVQAGEIQEACRVAASAVLDQHTYHGITVVMRAKEFDRLLGPSNCAGAHDWRELLASLRSPQLALATATEESS